MLTQIVTVKFTTYFFFRDKMPLDRNMLVFFLAKCVRAAAKTTVVMKSSKANFVT